MSVRARGAKGKDSEREEKAVEGGEGGMGGRVERRHGGVARPAPEREGEWFVVVSVRSRLGRADKWN